MCHLNECDHLFIGHDSFTWRRAPEPHLGEDAFQFVAVRQTHYLTIPKQYPQHRHTAMCSSEPRRLSGRSSLTKVPIPAPKIFPLKLVNPTAPANPLHKF